MKVKCISDKCYVHEKATSWVKENENFYESEYPIIPGKEYIVYAIVVREGYVRYFIVHEYYTYYPDWIPPILFDIVDNRLSRHWVYSYEKIEGYKWELSTWAYPEWAENLEHYDGLTDGEAADVKIWKNYKEKMDLEFPDPMVTVAAQIGDEEWLICHECFNAWQSTNTLDALVICPKCKKKLNNPRYCCRATFT